MNSLLPLRSFWCLLLLLEDTALLLSMLLALRIGDMKDWLLANPDCKLAMLPAGLLPLLLVVWFKEFVDWNPDSLPKLAACCLALLCI